MIVKKVEKIIYSHLRKVSKQYKDDVYQEIFIFEKKQKIKFAEDLREHSIEFYIFDEFDLIFEAGYKEILKKNEKFNTEILDYELKMAKYDTEEVEAYINFLVNNNIISS